MALKRETLKAARREDYACFHGATFSAGAHIGALKAATRAARRRFAIPRR